MARSQTPHTAARQRSRRIGASVVVAVALAVTLLACTLSPEQKHRWLTYFFDGVPPLGGATETPATEPTPLKRGQAPVRAGAPPGERTYRLTAHDQFSCSACHDLEQGMAPKATPAVLCVTCHDQAYPDRSFVHGPVALAQCGACHAVHWSKVPGVLLDRQPDVCTSCHSEPDLMRPVYHRDAGGVDCTSCHDPHGGDNRFLLRRIAFPETQPAALPTDGEHE